MSSSVNETKLNSTAEPLLEDNPRRFVLFPIKYLAIWRAYKKAVATFWIADTIEIEDEVEEWKNGITDPEKEASAIALIFLGATHKVMHERLLNQVCNEVSAPEVRCFFSFQSMTENIHAEALSKFTSNFLDGDTVRTLDPTDIESFSDKLQWSSMWTDQSNIPFSERLIALMAIKGLFSSSLHCILSWIAKQDILPGMKLTTSMIRLDNESQVDFSCLLFHHLSVKPSQDRAYEIITKAVDLEKEFATDMLENVITDIAPESLHRYIQFLGDVILRSMGYETYYGSPNTFSFMHHLTGEIKLGYFARQMETAYSNGNSKFAKGLEVKQQMYDFFEDNLH